MRRATITAIAIITAALLAAGCGEYGQRYTPPKKAEDAKNEVGPFDFAEQQSAGCGKIEKSKPAWKVPAKAQPRKWGVYARPQRVADFAANLKAGHVVVAHQGLKEKDQNKLVKYVERDAARVVVIPVAGEKKPGIYMYAWEGRLYCKQPSEPGVHEFVKRFRDASLTFTAERA